MNMRPKLTPWAQKPASWKLGGAGRVGPPPLPMGQARPVRCSLRKRSARSKFTAPGKPKTVRNDGVTVHGWPVHTPEWKREILRTVVEEG